MKTKIIVGAKAIEAVEKNGYTLIIRTAQHGWAAAGTRDLNRLRRHVALDGPACPATHYFGAVPSEV